MALLSLCSLCFSLALYCLSVALSRFGMATNCLSRLLPAVSKHHHSKHSWAYTFRFVWNPRLWLYSALAASLSATLVLGARDLLAYYQVDLRRLWRRYAIGD